MWLLLAGAARAAVLGGVAWVPLDLGAFSWDDADLYSGTQAGEFDGWLRPPLTAYGGWVGGHDAVLANVAYVQFSTEAYSDSNSRTVVGSARLGLDYRRYLAPRRPGLAGFYAQAGVFGIVPNVEDVDDARSADEQADADTTAMATAARLGGVGGQLGLGAEILFGDREGRPLAAVGARYLLRVWRGQVADDTGYTVSAVWMTEAALTFEIMR